MNDVKRLKFRFFISSLEQNHAISRHKSSKHFLVFRNNPQQ